MLHGSPLALLLLPMSAWLTPPAAAQTFPSTVDLSAQFSWFSNGMQVQAMAHDASGNVYIAGNANLGFPAATKTIGPAGNSDIFIVKLNASGDQILYATAIGGTAEDRVKDIKVDSAGNVYFVGATLSQDFPATTQFRPSYPIGGYVAKLAPTGATLTYATVLSSRISVLDVDVDANGAAYIVGSANSQDLPSTPGVLDPVPANGVDASTYVGYIAKVALDGTALDLATYYGGAGNAVNFVAIRPGGNLLVQVGGNLESVNTSLSQTAFSTPTGFSQARVMIEDSGSILVGGATPGSGLVALKRFTSEGAPAGLDITVELQSANLNLQMAEIANGQIFLFGDPIGATGQPSSFTTVNATQTCLSNMAGPGGIAGIAQSNGSGGLIGSVGGTAVNNHAMIVLDSAGTVVHSTFFTTGIEAVSVSPVDGRVYASGTQTIWSQPTTMWHGLVRINPELLPTDTLAPSCLVHAATFGVVPVTPGALMTFYGSNLGPGTTGSYTTGAQFTLDADNKVGPNLGGVSITVDGMPAPLLFAWTKQLNFVVPWEVRTDGTAVPVCITYNAETKCVSATTGPIAPGAFQVLGQSATINVDDGTVNYSGNPARRGSAVSVFITGTGKLSGTLTDGGVAGTPLAMVPGTQSAYFASTASNCSIFSCENYPKDTQVQVLYAGAAYGLVEGVTQLNLIIPSDMPSGPNKLFVVDFLLPGKTTPVSVALHISVAE